MFNQYKGLSREVYILFYGRIVTSMGELIWPMMTLILSNKMGMKASMIGLLLLGMSLIQLPFTLIGGKLADHFNKKYLIIFCDLVTVICYFICGFIPLSFISVALFFTAGLFAGIERPSYDALLADLTNSEERERAYSLSYLGMNLGMVLAPILGGFLFAKHLNIAFIITSLATFSSTMLILFFVKKIKREIKIDEKKNEYESNQHGISCIQLLKKNPIILFYTLLMGISAIVYSQLNFLLPLNMELNYGVKGAVYFGMLTSTNAFIVIVGTPLLTTLLKRMKDTHKMIGGIFLQVFGLAMYIFIQGQLWLSFVSMVIFTSGEILNVLGSMPYLSKRIPATHRGRIVSIGLVFTTLFRSIAQNGIAFLIDTQAITFVWCVVSMIGICSLVSYVILSRWDRKKYPLLYN